MLLKYQRERVVHESDGGASTDSDEYEYTNERKDLKKFEREMYEF